MVLAEDGMFSPSNGSVREGLLTSRERTVLRLVVERYDNQGIAELLHISKRTVETHVAALLRKLAVPDRRTLISTSGPDRFRIQLTRTLRNQHGDPAAVQEAVATLLCHHLGGDRAAYGAVDRTGRDPLAVAALATRTWIVRDARRDLGGQDTSGWAAWSVRAGVVVPSTRDGVCVAALGVFCRHPRDWTSEDVALMEETAERTWAHVERMRLTEGLRAERHRFQWLADSVPEPVWCTDAHGILTYANRSFRDLTGRSPGDGLAGVLVPDAGADRRERPVPSGVLRLRRATGGVDLEVHLTRDTGPDGAECGQIGIAHRPDP